jgi:hypothetical protein
MIKLKKTYFIILTVITVLMLHQLSFAAVPCHGFFFRHYVNRCGSDDSYAVDVYRYNCMGEDERGGLTFELEEVRTGEACFSSKDKSQWWHSPYGPDYNLDELCMGSLGESYYCSTPDTGTISKH